MTYDDINPLTGRVKEYKNSAEWIRDVEAYRAQNRTETPRPEVRTFADAAKRFKEECGVDLRSPAEQKEAAIAELIERKVAEGVSAALARQQEALAEKAQQAQKAEKVSLSPWPVIQEHSAQPRYKFFDGQKCGCKAEGHKRKAEPVIHSRRGIGPVMTAQKI